MSYIHASGYQFTPLTALEPLKQKLLSICHTLGLKGTILVSPEGINLNLCYTYSAIQRFHETLSQWFAIPLKLTHAPIIPFRRLQVKIKPHLIPFRELPNPWPEAPYLSPERFQEWLDTDKPMIVLDTRNQYEVAFGKFRKAMTLPLQHFRTFPEAIQSLPKAYKTMPVVTCCTGGIRCEKAAPYLLMQGFQEVYQLEGGILHYFEKCDLHHYEGTCFVFDDRLSLSASFVLPSLNRYNEPPFSNWEQTL